jgi:hypothetical protein
MLIYLYVAEPLLSHIPPLHNWTAYLPGVAADGLTQATQAADTPRTRPRPIQRSAPGHHRSPVTVTDHRGRAARKAPA